jgi:hypothetical protein
MPRPRLTLLALAPPAMSSVLGRALEQVPARGSSEALGARVFELAAVGLNSYEIARQLRRPRSTIA